MKLFCNVLLLTSAAIYVVFYDGYDTLFNHKESVSSLCRQVNLNSGGTSHIILLDAPHNLLSWLKHLGSLINQIAVMYMETISRFLCFI